MNDDGVPHREFIAFDLETTGLMPEIDRIVEIGAVRFTEKGEEIGRFQRLVNPLRRMSAAAFAIHGLSDEDLADAAPAREVLPEFLQFLGGADSTALMAHNASFDTGFLGCELSRAGLPLPDHPVFDTLALARRRLPQLDSHRLDVLAVLFELDPGGPHRALPDSLRVKDLWLRLHGAATAPEALVALRIIDPGQTDQTPEGWEPLRLAALRGWTVRMVYEGGTRGAAPRDVTPRRIVQKGASNYLVAYCHLDAFEKSFRLDRIRRFDILPAGRDESRSTPSVLIDGPPAAKVRAAIDSSSPGSDSCSPQ